MIRIENLNKIDYRLIELIVLTHRDNHGGTFRKVALH
jgi:hypothetical protein